MTAAPGLTALVLAGSRGPGDPLAIYAGVTHKALIEIGGAFMLERVVRALAGVPAITRIVIMIERPGLLVDAPWLVLAAGRCALEIVTAAESPSSSVVAALGQLGAPLLVTTADHALLQSQWVEYFLAACPENADACAALAPSEAVLQAVPQTQRTWLRFGTSRYSGCNLFYFASATGVGVARTWRAFEADRKRPWKMVGRLGWGMALRYALGRLTLEAALGRLGHLAQARLALVEMPFGLAAVDVDKPSDLDLVRALVGADPA